MCWSSRLWIKRWKLLNAPFLCEKSETEVSCILVPEAELHRCTWYSNTGGALKKIDHVLVDGRWRLARNCRFFQSAEFAGTHHRALVTTLRLRLKSREMAPSHQVRLDESRRERCPEVHRGVDVSIWKGKADTQECNNYMVVTHLFVAGKVPTRILYYEVREKKSVQILCEGSFRHPAPDDGGLVSQIGHLDRPE